MGLNRHNAEPIADLGASKRVNQCECQVLQIYSYARARLRGTLPHASRDDVENRVPARIER